MDITFISIHDLTPEAHILYSSDSVIDILGYTPDEIVNRSAWDFFPADELPYARQFHQKRVSMDKAAVLAYCRVRDKNGDWVGCECCFTICYDVMIVCTSVYRRGLQSEQRALEAPGIRRIFSSSPRDPRYHMLSHISAKFTQLSKATLHEPRAAVFLNRFTRTLTMMYATHGIQDIVGIPAETMRGRSFYCCIAENCLPDAVKCLENAKGNDSIAYLRFWFRDPRIDDQPPPPDDDSDEEMPTTEMSEDTDGGGVNLRSQGGTSPESAQSGHSTAVHSDHNMDVDAMEDDSKSNSRTSSGGSTHAADAHEAIFGQPREVRSSTSSIVPPLEPDRSAPPRTFDDAIELEAVISCTSDGLVVCLRKARPMIPHPLQRPSRPVYKNGLFAAPWAAEPILPRIDTRPGAGFSPAFAPALGPHGARHDAGSPVRVGGPAQHDFMSAIRDQAIFAWALTGINGSLAEYSRGKPMGESQPYSGLPVWASDPHQRNATSNGNTNGWHSAQETREGCANRSPSDGRPGTLFFGDPGLDRSWARSSGSGSSSSGVGTPFGRC